MNIYVHLYVVSGIGLPAYWRVKPFSCSIKKYFYMFTFSYLIYNLKLEGFLESCLSPAF